MRTVFLVNHRHELLPTQTTSLLIAAAVRRGHEVQVAGIDDLSAMTDRALTADASHIEARTAPSAVAQLVSSTPHPISLEDCDLCIVRTNPGRDRAHQTHHVSALRLLEQLEKRGVCVVNPPRALSRAMTKLPLFDLPEHLQPRTLVTANPAHIERFLREMGGRAVIKPVLGSWGRDVFLLGSLESNEIRHRIDAVLSRGYAMVQEFVESAQQGDLRVTILDGAILSYDGQPAAIARVPQEGDFRSNLHAGGEAQPATITPQIQDAVAAIAPYLVEEGLVHVGADFIGGRILELNVFSPGGLYPSARLYGHDFSEEVIEAFERHGRRAAAR